MTQLSKLLINLCRLLLLLLIIRGYYFLAEDDRENILPEITTMCNFFCSEVKGILTN